MIKRSALKHLFNLACLKRISDSFSDVYPVFNREHFLGIMPKLKDLEMKPRVRFIRDELHRQLPGNYLKALALILKAVNLNKMQSFDLWPLTEFIQTYGLANADRSLAALKEITPQFTAEWAVRPFLIQNPKNTLGFLRQCADDADVDFRRWASEGTRPRLPWGERLPSFIQDPSPALPILEKLKFDPELYVRKSVSNHLNDISKDHPELVIKILKRWQKEAGKLHADKVRWIIHRALRSMIKAGDAQALQLIGVSQKPLVKIANFKILRNKIKLGERLDFKFELISESKKSQKIVVDFIIHHLKANRTTKAKVFKLKTFGLTGLETKRIQKSQAFKKITTREYYPGIHALEIQVNGVVVAKKEWTLAV